MKQLLLFAFTSVLTFSCIQKKEVTKPYVLEVTTFRYKTDTDPKTFWKEDAKIERRYTSKQAGFINRESGYAPNTNEVVVVVQWETQADVEASMQKFIGDTSVQNYAQMIDGPTMQMERYNIKNLSNTNP